MGRIVADDEHRPLGDVPPLVDPVEVGQRHALPHRGSETLVVAMSPIAAAIAIQEQPVFTDPVVVRSFPPRDVRGRADAQRQTTHRGPEDPLLAHERHAPPVELEPLSQNAPRHLVRVDATHVLQEAERAKSDRAVAVPGTHADSTRLRTNRSVSLSVKQA